MFTKSEIFQIPSSVTTIIETDIAFLLQILTSFVFIIMVNKRTQKCISNTIACISTSEGCVHVWYLNSYLYSGLLTLSISVSLKGTDSYISQNH